MPNSYVLEEKKHLQTFHEGFGSLSEALAYMKELIRENCIIDAELNAIKNENLPAPNYKASVALYLEELFTKEKFPSHKIIDYSDYMGTPRKFDPNNFYEFVEFDDFEHVTSFDNALGFIFVAGENGMQLAFNGRDSMMLCYFKRYKDMAFFGVEYWNSQHEGIDVRIHKSGNDLSARPQGSFYPLLLLDILLKQTEMRQIHSKPGATSGFFREEHENSLEWMMSHTLYTKMNDIYHGFVLPSRFSFLEDGGKRERLITEYISTIKNFGYDVKKCTVNNINSYYIPPFICKHDSDIILDCIKNSDLAQIDKKRIIEKFNAEAGCHRYFENDFEESALPQPHAKDWSSKYCALIIYHTLRFYARPLPKSSKNKDSIQSFAETYYEVELDRKKTIPNHTESMIAMGLPIQRINGKYCFDISKLLIKEDIDIIVKCITESSIAENEKHRLIQKLNDKFPTGKY